MRPRQVPRFKDFRESIANLPGGGSIRRDLLDTGQFELASDERLRVVYAPFDHVNWDAQIALVGVTPGWVQMHNAFVEAQRLVIDGVDEQTLLREVKRVAAFSGTIRRNLIEMLDGIRAHELLGLATTEELFSGDAEHLAHLTSAIRYPVFRHNGDNYPGTNPSLTQSDLLRPFLTDVLAPELQQIPAAVIVPLGRSAEDALAFLEGSGHISPARVLKGFPHPSGANAHRRRQYESNRETLTTQLLRWQEQIRCEELQPVDRWIELPGLLELTPDEQELLETGVRALSMEDKWRLDPTAEGAILARSWTRTPVFRLAESDSPGEFLVWINVAHSKRLGTGTETLSETRRALDAVASQPVNDLEGWEWV